MRKSGTYLVLAGLTASLLAGCSTVKIPKIDFLKMPEFREDAVNIKDFPKAENAPVAPTDVRSAKDWDNAAKDIMKVRDDFESLDTERSSLTEAQLEAEIEALKNQARAYKLDDPQ